MSIDSEVFRTWGNLLIAGTTTSHFPATAKLSNAPGPSSVIVYPENSATVSQSRIVVFIKD